MTTRNDNIDLRTKVQIICLYFSKLPSNDKRRSKIISKYRELEILSGIKANTIRQWTDSFDPYFDNGRKGYHQRDLENENKSLWKRLDIAAFNGGKTPDLGTNINGIFWMLLIIWGNRAIDAADCYRWFIDTKNRTAIVASRNPEVIFNSKAVTKVVMDGHAFIGFSLFK